MVSLIGAAARTLVESSWRDHPLAAVSAEVTGPDRSIGEVLSSPRLRTRRTYAAVPVVDLIAGGFPVLATFAAPHVSIVLHEYDEAPSSRPDRDPGTRADEPVLREDYALMTTRVTLPADVHQIDATGFVWTFLDEADDLNGTSMRGNREPGAGFQTWTGSRPTAGALASRAALGRAQGAGLGLAA